MSGLSSTLDLPCSACDGLISAPGFFPQQVCPLCSEGICSVCWDEGRRACRQHAAALEAEPAARRVWRGQARSYEAFFIDAVLSSVGRVGSLPHPQTGKRLPVDPDVRPLETDESVQLDRLLDRRRDLTAAEVRGCPKGRRLTLAVARRGLFGAGGTALVLVAACVARLERYVDPGWDAEPGKLEELARTLQRWALAPDVMHYVGAFSPTGWERGARAEELCTAARQVVLVEPAEDAASGGYGFSFRTYRPALLDGEIARIFDPESPEAKVARAAGYLARHPALAPPGGLLLLEEELALLSVERSHLEQAVRLLVQEDDRLLAEQLDGEWILRRRRS